MTKDLIFVFSGKGCLLLLLFIIADLDREYNFSVSASYLVIDIEPFRVMVHLFCLQSYPGHETKSLEGKKQTSSHTLTS